MPLFSSKAQLTPAASGSKLALADVNLIAGAFKVYPTLATLQNESVNYFTDAQVVMVSASSQLYQATVFEPDYISSFSYSASFSPFSFAGSGGGSGDITAVNAGLGLSGGASTGDATLTLNTSSAHFTTAVSASAAAAGFGAGGDTIPNGTISSSQQITDLGFISSSHTDISELNTFTGSIQSEVNSLTAATASYLTSLPNGVVSSSAQTVANLVGQNISVGVLTATEVVTNVVSQSISFATGSTIFGDDLTDVHQITGSFNLTGSFSFTEIDGGTF